MLHRYAEFLFLVVVRPRLGLAHSESSTNGIAVASVEALLISLEISRISLSSLPAIAHPLLLSEYLHVLAATDV